MPNRIKNLDTVTHTWGGMDIAAGATYTCNPGDDQDFGNDSMFLADLAANKAEVQDPTGVTIAALSLAIDALKGNAQRVLLDDDDAQMQRPKYAEPGWNYHMRSASIETSKMASLRCVKVHPTTKAKTDWGDVTLKFFKTDGTELVQGGGETDIDYQARLDADCAFTQLDFEPPHDMEVIGGAIMALDDLTQDIWASVIGVPDLSVELGGTKYFVSDVNLNFLPAKGEIKADGRTTKRLAYDVTYHTNKLRALFDHATGFKTKLQVIYEIYRP